MRVQVLHRPRQRVVVLKIRDTLRRHQILVLYLLDHPLVHFHHHHHGNLLLNNNNNSQHILNKLLLVDVREEELSLELVMMFRLGSQNLSLEKLCSMIIFLLNMNSF
ncbi:hypothetical protein PSTG_19349 [Puccinia striiformis f. sp. tritici PST-78]|uniref:Uncharacterized protein n=1 Tax=Puccinia striiformis f. sp. tritici PST-78 TaxID=1165861 RepID=A0A0L0UJZ3_9BASI|nr:hypothetical protein PSTG_19349 [Puccinia striiformis f. sp. tritici PST-78]